MLAGVAESGLARLTWRAENSNPLRGSNLVITDVGGEDGCKSKAPARLTSYPKGQDRSSTKIAQLATSWLGF